MKRNFGKKLITKYLNKTAKAKEIHIVEDWYALEVFRNLNQNPLDEDFERIKKEMWRAINANDRKNTTWLKSWYAYAAVLALFFLGIFSYQVYRSINQNTERVSFKTDILPGKTGATLILSNGRRINLNEAKKGELDNSDGISVVKHANGQLAYVVKGGGASNVKTMDHTLVTSNGQTYSIFLPDGSKVWLNADSKLTFSNQLATAKIRSVRLEGEGYFEVTKKNKPFVVETGDQKVKVLGTHFNINAYGDLIGIKTTLLEGAVKVLTAKGAGTLKPGQQSLNRNGNIAISIGDPETSIAWKEGYFKFDDDLQSIMAQIARWYNVDLVFAENAPRNVRLWGYISRDNKLSSILDQLSRTNKVHFKLEGRTLYVMNP